jgi:hypothetical protein
MTVKHHNNNAEICSHNKRSKAHLTKIIMRPWERRLRDLAHLLINCGDTYFSPDRFRQNTNQFLQTSRTVTFIIQKHKATIPDFDTWYKENVLLPWADDRVMLWAKDARNVVEKEGDLDMQSVLRSTVLFSYVSEEDMVLETNRHDLLQANIERLLKMAFRTLPSGIAEAAVLKIQRKWIANSLLDCELIYALTYAYAQLHQICSALAAHLGSSLDASIPHPTDIDPASNDVAKVRFLKFGALSFSKHSQTRISADPKFKPSPELAHLKKKLDSAPKASSLAEIMKVQAKMAQFTFEGQGNHIPMLMLYDKHWNPIDFISVAFFDQADKFIFWRDVADRAFYLKAHAFTWTSESWLRDLKDHRGRSFRELPIIGEQLHVVGADALGAIEVVMWDIARPDPSRTPALTPVAVDHPSAKPGRMAFIEPVVAAMKMARANRS